MKKVGKTALIFMLGIIVSFSMNVAAEVVLSSESVSYFNSKTSETNVSGALDELFSAIEISNQIGDMTTIASIGDGTITGAIDEVSSSLIKVKKITLSTSTASPVYADYITPYEGTITNVTNTIKSTLPDGATILGISIAGCMWNASHGITGIANYVSTYDRIYLQTSKTGLYLVDVLVFYN